MVRVSIAKKLDLIRTELYNSEIYIRLFYKVEDNYINNRHQTIYYNRIVKLNLKIKQIINIMRTLI